MNKKVLNTIIGIIFIIIILILGLIIKSKGSNENSILLSSQIEEKESKIEELSKELETEKENLSKLQEDYNNCKTNNVTTDTSSLKKEIEEKESKIEELNNEIKELKNSTSSTSSKSELASKKKKIAELEKNIEELNNEIETKTTKINELNNEIETNTTNITNLENEILTKTNKIEELEKEIEVLKNSYLVAYVADSTIVKTVNVEKGKNVSNVPNVPSKTGYTGTWSKDGKNITEDTIIFADYTTKTYNIYYKLDFGTFNDINIADFEIDGTKYVYMSDFEAVYKLGENYNPNGNNTFEIDNVQYTCHSGQNYVTSPTNYYYGDIYGRYFIFYINDQTYIMNINNKSVYSCTMYSVRTDFVFVVGNNHYRIGGDEFAVYDYYNDKSYKMDRIYYRLEWIYYYIEDNKVYDENDAEVTSVVNNKFTLNIYDEDHEYTLDSHYPGAIEVSSTGTFKNKSILTTSYKYGDRVVKLSNIYESINELNVPRYATPNSWLTKLFKSNNELYLIEETYGDIYIYVDWNTNYS